MREITVRAYAKVNLALDVLGWREDGYHDLRMVMQTVSLCDTLTLKPRRGTAGGIRFRSRANLPTDGRNLAVAAARLFLTRIARTDISLDIGLVKRIPVCAGLGGGSADAAAVLRALRDVLAPEITDETLCGWGLELGSDVPYCVLGGTRLAEGRGEVLTPLPQLPVCHIVLCKPSFFISTRAAFAGLGHVGAHPDIPSLTEALARGDLHGVGQAIFNVFEAGAVQRHGALGLIRKELEWHGALGAVMSGSGPTMLGLYDDEAKARTAVAALKPRFSDTFLCKPGERKFSSMP